jgi:hypothetical protein
LFHGCGTGDSGVREGHYPTSPSLNVTISVYPPNEPVMTVTHLPKLTLLDFVVYSLSCISFWFGFCPLSTPAYWKKTVSFTDKTRTIANHLRNRLQRHRRHGRSLNWRRHHRVEPEMIFIRRTRHPKTSRRHSI